MPLAIIVLDGLIVNHGHISNLLITIELLKELLISWSNALLWILVHFL